MEVFDPATTLVSRLIRQVKVKVTLRLTVSQSVCLGVEPQLGLMARLFLFVSSLYESYCPVHLERPL
jgi:hypothetical protein